MRNATDHVVYVCNTVAPSESHGAGFPLNRGVYRDRIGVVVTRAASTCARAVPGRTRRRGNRGPPATGQPDPQTTLAGSSWAVCVHGVGSSAGRNRPRGRLDVLWTNMVPLVVACSDIRWCRWYAAARLLQKTPRDEGQAGGRERRIYRVRFAVAKLGSPWQPRFVGKTFGRSRFDVAIKYFTTIK